jgi:DNA-binding MarR family transcriptional regulator
VKDDAMKIDFDILPTLVGYHLRRAQITIFNDFVKTVGAVHVTPGQFGVALLICANPGLTQSALARAIVIDALESRNLVERRPSPIDRRSYALVLSDQGSVWLKKLKPLVEGHEEQISKNLSADEKAQLISLLSKIVGD